MRPFLSRPSNESTYEFRALSCKLLPGIVLAIFLLLYFLPNMIEVVLVQSGAPSAALFMVGDLIGCTVIAVVLNLRWALGIYLFASGLKYVIFHYGGVDSRTLIWISDLLPALIVAALVLYASYRGRNWRRTMRAFE